MILRLLCSALVLLGLLSLPPRASALEARAAPAAPASSDAPASSARADAERDAWRPEWQRFRPWEYAATAAALATGLGVRFFGPDPPRRRWDIENGIADALAVRGSGRGTLRLIGDIGFVGTLAYRSIDSALLTSLNVGPDVGWQAFMMDLEAFSVTAVVLWGTQVFVGRERPRYRDCSLDAPLGPICQFSGADRYRSFIAGHVAVATTGASLTCLHHARLRSYGGAADDAACATHVGVAIVTAVSRITTEAHYPSDTLLAGALGVFAGYVVPSALHYGFGGESAGAERPRATTEPAAPSLRVMLLPRVAEGLGLDAIGSF